MTWIMSPVLTTLKTDDINRLNNARSRTDGVFVTKAKMKVVFSVLLMVFVTFVIAGKYFLTFIK